MQVFVCCWPPKHPLHDDLALYEYLPALVCEKITVLYGDFNCPGVDWDTDLARYGWITFALFQARQFPLPKGAGTNKKH